MTWAPGNLTATLGISASTIKAGLPAYYDKKFLRPYYYDLRIAPLGQSRPLPEGMGTTATFFRYHDIAVSLSGAHLTEGHNPDPTLVTGSEITATIREWGAFSQHSSLISHAHIDRKLSKLSGMWGANAAKTMDLLCACAVAAEGSYPIRADGAWTAGVYYYAGTITTATSTTVIADTSAASNTNFGDGNDDFNQSVIVFTSGSCKGISRAVTDYVTSGGVITMAPALDMTPAVGDTFVVVSAHGLTTSNPLSTTNVRKAVQTLRNNKAVPLRSDMFVGVLCADTEAGLMADTNWTNVMQYRDRPDVKVNGLFAGEVGEWGGVRWVRTTQPHRFPITTVGTAGGSYGVGAFDPANSLYTNYAETGAVYSTMIFGQEAFGRTTFEGADKSMLKPGVIIKTPGPHTTSDPLGRYSTVGWVIPAIAKGLNSLFAVQIWSAA